MTDSPADAARLYLRPIQAADLDGYIELIAREGAASTRTLLARNAVEAWAGKCGGAREARITSLLKNIDSKRGPIAGVDLEQPRIMAVVNVTPDSFSDGGKNYDPDVAIRAGQDMAKAGADIIDVGGVSTRPGSSPPSEAEELARVLPVIRALTEDGLTVSIDTRRAAVMVGAIEAGAKIINDISALLADPESLGFAAQCDAPIILMHMQGEPETMQQAPVYHHVSLDIFDYLEARIEICLAAGISRDRLIVDPGIGFGKTIEHNLQILRDLALLHGLGCPLLVGLSRKYFIAALSAGEPAPERLPGSIAGALHAISQGAQIVRVHDAGETSQAIKVWQAIRGDNEGNQTN
ncbi:MAG: dihydropteroate synthase [Rhodospirillaceae bacterium]|nr:dihydropteroate synthase [Rhodospirillaceae bacterium]